MSRSSFEFGSGARSRPLAGRRDSNAARARRSRLLTDASVVSSISATSAARKPEHVAQHEHRPLLRRQVLEADDERQRDRLLGLVARLGAGSVVRDPLEQHVGVGLEPDRLAVAGRLGHLGHPLQVSGAAPARTQGVERAVGGDPVQPGADRRPLLELLEAAPGGEQRLLQQVLGVLRRADDPVDVQLELTPVRVGQLAERRLVAGARVAPGSARSLPHPLTPLALTCITRMTSGRPEIRRSIFAGAGRLNWTSTDDKEQRQWEGS